jgi:hypothetical protein
MEIQRNKHVETSESETALAVSQSPHCGTLYTTCIYYILQHTKHQLQKVLSETPYYKHAT